MQDVSGQDRLRSFWRHYYHGTTGVVFVVDSHDVERLPIARKELHGILKEEELAHAVLLIVANKMDLPRAVSVEQLRVALDLQALGDRVLHIQPAVAQTGKGLKEGLFWLAKAMKNQAKTQGGAGGGFTAGGSASASALTASGGAVAQSPNHLPPSSYQASSSSSTAAYPQPAPQPAPLASSSTAAPLPSTSSTTVQRLEAGAVLAPAVLTVVPPSALSSSAAFSSSVPAVQSTAVPSPASAAAPLPSAHTASTQVALSTPQTSSTLATAAEDRAPAKAQ